MRPYRGKSTNKRLGEWVYGWYVDVSAHDDSEQAHRIVKQLKNGIVYIPVIPKTVGQYTGLKDKNGKEIYEGDIIGIYEDGTFVCKQEVFWLDTNVVFDGWACKNCWATKDLGEITSGYINAISHLAIKYHEIIGTIHDEEKP